MTTERISAEELIAYLDGESPADQVRRVENALKQDAGLQAALHSLERGTVLLRAAFAAPLHQPIPEAWRSVIQNAPATSARGRIRAPEPFWQRWRMPAALAASVAAVAISAAGGYFFASQRITDEIARVETARVEDHKALLDEVEVVLEKHLSGQTVNWTDPQTGRQVSITPVRTFRSGAGQWCREYVEVVEIKGEVERRRGIACREHDGDWKSRLEVLEGS